MSGVGLRRSNRKRRQDAMVAIHEGGRLVAKGCPDCVREGDVEPQPIGRFYVMRKQPDGYDSYCKKHRNIRKRATTQRSVVQPISRFRARLRANYGLTLAQYETMLAAQGGGCAICGAPPSSTQNYGRERLAVDHDHSSGAVRGLLCAACNKGLGHFLDSVESLARAIVYLQKAGTCSEISATS